MARGSRHDDHDGIYFLRNWTVVFALARLRFVYGRGRIYVCMEWLRTIVQVGKINTRNIQQLALAFLRPWWELTRENLKQGICVYSFTSSFNAHQLKVFIFVPRLSIKPLHYQTPFSIPHEEMVHEEALGYICRNRSQKYHMNWKLQDLGRFMNTC